MGQGFFNTVGLEGQALIQFTESALSHKSLVLRFFELNSGKAYTPIEAHTQLQIKGCARLLTSTRRAISDLTEEGELVKLPKEKQKKERYGMLNNRWQYNTHKDRTNQF